MTITLIFQNESILSSHQVIAHIKSLRVKKLYSALVIEINRSSRPDVFCKKGVVRNFAKLTGRHLCQGLSFNKVAALGLFIKKETLAQVFSCEFCEISKNTFSYRTPLVAASGLIILNKFIDKVV